MNVRPLAKLAALAAVGLALAGLVPLIASCDGDVLPPKGQLMLVVTSNMAPPKDFDTLHVEVREDGATAPALDVDYALGGSQAVKLPATLGIVAGSDPNKIVRVTVEGRRGDAVRVRRLAVTRVPPDRIATLPMPIDGLCVDTSCPPAANGDPQTCIAGSCQSAKVESSELPDYSAVSVFGGGTGRGDGTCFDTLSCFSTGRVVPVRRDDCTIAKELGVGFNVAVVGPPGSDGVCGSNACLLVLDKDPFVGPIMTGWREVADRVLLPRAVCERGLSVMTTTTCATKSAPTCGPWSAVGSGSGITADASVPLGDAGFGDAAMGPSPTGVTFLDVDPRKDFVSGTVTVGRAADESGITGYELYWADGPTKKMTRIASLPKTGSDVTHELAGAVPPGASWLVALSVAASGPLAPEVSVGPVDNYPRGRTITVNNLDMPEPITLLDGNTLLIVGMDDSTASARIPTLLRCQLDGSGCTYSDISTGISTANPWRLGAAIDPVNKKLLVVSDRDVSSFVPRLFRCNLDGTGCTSAPLPAPPIGGVAEDCDVPVIVDAKANKLLIIKNNNSNHTFLYRCNLDGTGCVTSGLSGPSVGRCARALLRDTTLFVVRLNVAGPSLYRCGVDGTGCAEDAISGTAMVQIATAIDEVNGKVVSVSHRTNDAVLTLHRCNFDGTGCASGGLPMAPTINVRDPHLLLDPARKKLYAFYFGGDARASFVRCDLDGTKCSDVILSPTPNIGGYHTTALIHDGKVVAVSSALGAALYHSTFSAY